MKVEIPHAPPILAVREVVAADAGGAEVRMLVGADSTLTVDGRLPCWAALELVGQAAAAHAAALGSGPGGAGFLVRARAWRFAVPELPIGETLTVRLVRVDPDARGPSGAFEGAVLRGDAVLAEGKVLVQAG